MTGKLTDLERLRREKLIWLYCVEVGDEGPCSSNGTDIPTAAELSDVLHWMDVDADVDTLRAILEGASGISNEFAAAIEEGFNMPAGWLSQP